MGKNQSKNSSRSSSQTSTENRTASNVINSTMEQLAVLCVGSHDDRLYCGKENGEVEIITTSNSRMSYKIHSKAICKLDICSKNGLLFTASRDKTLSARSIDSSQSKSFIGHTLPVLSLNCNEDGTHLVSGSRDCSVALWDVNTEEQILKEEIPRNLVTDLKWNHQSNIVVQCSEDKIMKLWDARSLTHISSFPMKQYFQTCCDFSNDGTHIVTGSVGGSGSGCELIIWDIRQLKQMVVMKGHSQSITSCAFCRISNKERIITTSNDCSVRVWDPLTQICCSRTFISGCAGVTSSVVMEDGSIFVGTLQSGVHKLKSDGSNLNYLFSC